MLPVIENSFDSDYDIINEIGSGSFSEVWLCVHRATGQKRAAKILKEDFGTTMNAAAWNSIAEVNVANSMRKHPFLLMAEVAYHELELGKVILITELMAKTLYDIIKDKCVLTDYQIKIYAYQMLEGLRYLHEKQFIHRDVKPENVLVTSRDRCLKIGDFGTACRVVVGRPQPPHAEYVATRWYRAPECLLTRGRYGTKMDVWAAGCVLFETATGRPLFDGADAAEQLAKIDAVLGVPEQRLIDRFAKHGGASDALVERYGSGGVVGGGRGTAGAGLRSVYQPYRPAYNVLKDMIVYDPLKRLSADRLLRKEYFHEMRCTEYEHALREFRQSQQQDRSADDGPASCGEEAAKQPSTNKKQESGEDHGLTFLERAGPCEKIKSFICINQKPDDISCLIDKKQNASKACSKWGIPKQSTVQKSVNTSPKKENQYSLSKLNLKNIFAKKTQLVTKSLPTLGKVLKTKKVENSPMNVKSFVPRRPVEYVVSDRILALSKPRIRGDDTMMNSKSREQK